MPHNRLFTAIENADNANVAALLDKGCDVNAVDKQGRTALVFAVSRMDVEMVRLLLSRGANVELRVDDHTPLMHAVQSGCLDVVTSLVHAGANIIAKNKGGLSAMPLAILEERVDIGHMLASVLIRVPETTLPDGTVVRVVRPFGRDEVEQFVRDHGGFLSSAADGLVSRLVSELRELTSPAAAKVLEETETWGEHPDANMKILQKPVLPLSAYLRPLVDTTMAAWGHRPAQLSDADLSVIIGIFQSVFESGASFGKGASMEHPLLRQLFTHRPHSINSYGTHCHQCVLSLEWVYAFVWQLPSADPARAKEYRKVGKAMAAVFMAGTLFDHKEEYGTEPDPNVMVKSETLFRLACGEGVAGSTWQVSE